MRTRGGQYPKFDAISEKVTNYLKSVRSKIRELVSDNQKLRNNDEIHALEVEAEFLRKKVYRYNRSFDENVSIVRETKVR